MAKDNTLQTIDPRDVTTATEATRPGVLLTPPVDIFEDPNSITVVADMPGVKPGQLVVTAGVQKLDAGLTVRPWEGNP